MPAAVSALVAVYLGYVAGAWLVPPGDERTSIPWLVIRATSGLLLITIAFLLSLVLSIPWFVGPAFVLGGALLRHRLDAVRVRWPHVRFSIDAGVATFLGAILVSPIIVSASLMAPGDVPPVFFNVDTPYALEQVQSLARADTYPPPSLGNLGGGRSYHFATMGMAALAARTGWLRPHHALFVLVLPLLALGILASAFAAADALAPAIPKSASVPLLIVMVPSFWYSFSDVVAPLLWTALQARDAAPLDALTSNYELWGPASIVSQNVGAHMLVLATLAAVAAAPARGWTLPVFLLGTGILVKVSTGVALVAGFLLAQAWRLAVTRDRSAARPAAAVAAVFLATYAAFWIVPETPPDFAVEPFALFHIRRMDERDALLGLVFDVAWVLLPAALVARTARTGSDARGLPLFLYALAPFLVVNVTASIDQRPGGGGASDDWLQVLLPVPFILHAFVLAAASACWTAVHAATRAAVLVLLAASIVPPVVVAGRYARVLVQDPQNGHEFVDNRAIAAALAAVPVEGALIVTNDLRYPAQRFGRDNRQMQIPALYGHQAFAVNYAYEVYAFSAERRGLQALLQSETWSDAITAAARTHGWTHLLVRKDYAHPATIPLTRIFENDDYAVYRFEP